MKKSLNLLLLLLLVTISFGESRKAKQDIINITDLQDKEILFALFVSIDDCQKCVNLPMRSIECSIDKIRKVNSDFKYKLIAIVKCDRPIELKRFKKLFYWDHPVLKQTDGLYKELNISEGVEIAIFDSDLDTIVNIYQSDKAKCEKISRYINNLK